MEHFHTFSCKANYYQIGNKTNPERLWVVCHGYGQLASRFIGKFETLDMSKNLVIAPEGLSHYYLEGLKGNVGASWMTKHNREVEIENQFEFLESLMKEKVMETQPERITLLGFSQGGATICRWADNTDIPFHDIYLWATIFPPDMSLDFLEKTLKDTNVKIFYGDQDPFIKDEHLSMAQEVLKKVPHLEIVKFHGDHRVMPEVLLENLD
jgi:predicted esterase